MTDRLTKKIDSFLEENRAVECSLCRATVAFQNKRTGGMVGVGFALCRCVARMILEAPPSPSPDLGKEAREHEEVQRDTMKERKLREEEGNFKNARELEPLKKRGEEEEAFQQQHEEEEETRRKQKVEEEKALTLRKFKEEARKKVKDDERRRRKEIRQKWSAEKKEAESMNMTRKTWTGMKYSSNFKSGAIVHVVFPWTPIDFQVVCDDDKDQLEVLTEHLLWRVTSGKLKKIDGKLQKNDVVIAEYEGAYYRARVTCAGSTQCKLSFIDYGGKAIKKYEEIYEIPEDLYKEPVYGLKVRLDGLEPTDFSMEALFCETSLVEPETAYSLELVNAIDMKNIFTHGILRDINSGKILNEVVEKTLQKL